MFNPAFEIRADAFRAGNVFQDNVWTFCVPICTKMFDFAGLHDVRMFFKTYPGICLLGETGNSALIIEEATLKSLDRYGAFFFQVVAQIDQAHPAAQNMANLEPVADVIPKLEFAAFTFLTRRAGNWRNRAAL